MTDKQTLKKWTTPPDGAMSGRCPDPTCHRLHCLDPFFTYAQFDAAQGTSVIMSYTKPNLDQIIRVNGEDLGAFSTQQDREKVFWILALKYGDDAEKSLMEHLIRRLEWMNKPLLN